MSDPPIETTSSARDMNADVVAFLAGRSAPCPRCGYDLRDNRSAVCPECAEPLVLKVGTPRSRFGWLIFAMVPGCFSGVAALFVMVPIAVGIWQGSAPGQNLPWPLVGADVFGFLSAGAVVLMYRHRHRLMSTTLRRQRAFAAGVWGVHVLAFVAFVAAMSLFI